MLKFGWLGQNFGEQKDPKVLAGIKAMSEESLPDIRDTIATRKERKEKTPNLPPEAE